MIDAAPGAKLAQETILIVDDDAVVRTIRKTQPGQRWVPHRRAAVV